MSDFEKELKRRKEEKESEALKAAKQRRVEDETLRERVNQERAEKDMQQRQFYERYIAPIKPLVDDLIDDVARTTWKRGYGHSFRFNERGATWTVGRNQWYDFNRKFGSKLHWEPISDREPNQHSVKPVDGRSFQKSETFSLTLTNVQLRGFNENLHRDIREELAQAYLQGPVISYPASKFDSFSMRSG